MEELLLALARDLPSTAALLLILYLVNKQFTGAAEQVGRHLDRIHRLLELCITQNREADPDLRNRDRRGRRLTPLEDLDAID